MYVCLGSENTLDMHVCNLGSKQLPHEIYICMFRWQDTLDMHVYSKNTSKKYTHV